MKTADSIRPAAPIMRTREGRIAREVIGGERSFSSTIFLIEPTGARINPHEVVSGPIGLEKPPLPQKDVCS
jgi:hypothetical protein